MDDLATICDGFAMKNLSPNARGVVFMIGSMAFFVFNDAAMKAVGAHLPLSQAVVLRGVPTIVFLALIALWSGAFRQSVSRPDRKRIALRNLTEIGAAYFFLTAIFNMELANATAILQILPLTVTLAAAVFLGEPVGWRRTAAIVVGFLGVLLIVRPGIGGFNVYSPRSPQCRTNEPLYAAHQRVL